MEELFAKHVRLGIFLSPRNSPKMMNNSMTLRFTLIGFIFCILLGTRQVGAEGTHPSSKTPSSPEVTVVKEAIYYVLSPESALLHKQASDAVYWIVRTACDQVPDQTPEIASVAIHAISHSAERTVLTRMAAANETSASQARQLSSSVSATVTARFNDYIKKAVRAVFDGRGFDHHSKVMLQNVVDSVSIRLVRDLSMQAALSDKLMKSGKWSDTTSLPVATAKTASELTRDVCGMMRDQAVASGFEGPFVVSVFQTAQTKCFQVARNEAQQHFDERVGSNASGLASKVVNLKSGGEAILLYHPCPVVTALEQLRSRNSLSNMRALRGVIRSSLGDRH